MRAKSEGTKREAQFFFPQRYKRQERERERERGAMAMIKSWGQEALMTEAWNCSSSSGSSTGSNSGCGSGGSTHSVFNEPFAALALNLLIELEPAAGCRM